VEPTSEHVVVVLGGIVVADTRRALRVLETTHPPGYYLPREDFTDGVLEAVPGSSFCEFKGTAAYLDVVAGGHRAARAGWYYPDPTPPYAALAGHIALYPAPFDRVTVDEENVVPQEGGFYGGWITSRVTGPFKGGPGSRGW
jgi:uncharacterized protein (DUF427 family)